MGNEDRSHSAVFSSPVTLKGTVAKLLWAKTHTGERVLETPCLGWFAPRTGYTRKSSNGEGTLLIRSGHPHTEHDQQWAQRAQVQSRAWEASQEQRLVKAAHCEWPGRGQVLRALSLCRDI